MFAAGDRAPVEEALNMLIAMREFKRHQQMHGGDGTYVARRAGIDPDRLERLFRLLGIAERKERFVIPTARYETAWPQNSPSQARPPATGRGGEDA
jgi:nitrate reductase beta subunit